MQPDPKTPTTALVPGDQQPDRRRRRRDHRAQPGASARAVARADPPAGVAGRGGRHPRRATPAAQAPPARRRPGARLRLVAHRRRQRLLRGQERRLRRDARRRRRVRRRRLLAGARWLESCWRRSRPEATTRWSPGAPPTAPTCSAPRRPPSTSCTSRPARAAARVTSTPTTSPSGARCSPRAASRARLYRGHCQVLGLALQARGIPIRFVAAAHTIHRFPDSRRSSCASAAARRGHRRAGAAPRRGVPAARLPLDGRPRARVLAGGAGRPLRLQPDRAPPAAARRHARVALVRPRALVGAIHAADVAGAVIRGLRLGLAPAARRTRVLAYHADASPLAGRARMLGGGEPTTLERGQRSGGGVQLAQRSVGKRAVARAVAERAAQRDRENRQAAEPIDQHLFGRRRLRARHSRFAAARKITDQDAASPRQRHPRDPGARAGDRSGKAGSPRSSPKNRIAPETSGR